METLKSSQACADLTELVTKIRLNADVTDREARFPAENVKLLGERGLLGLLVPEVHGGSAADAEQFIKVVRTIASGCASTGMVFVMHSCAIDTIAKNQPSMSQVLSDAAKGKHLSTLACSERGTGANFYASFSKSSASDSSFILDGEKCFVTSGGNADSYVVSAQAVGSNDCLNTSIYFVERDTPGQKFLGEWKGLGLRGNSSVNMKLDACQIPKKNLIGQEGAGLQIEMATVLPRFLLGTSAVYNGVSEAAINGVVNHLTSRSHEHTGEALSALPVLRNKLAQLKVTLDSSIALSEKSARKFDEQSEDMLISLLEAKQMACRTAVLVTTTAMELCGGIAYSTSLPLERHLRDAQAGVVMAPTDSMCLDLIGRAALGLPLL